MGALELDQRNPRFAIRNICEAVFYFILGAAIIVSLLFFVTAIVYNFVDPEFRVESAGVSQLSHDGSPELARAWNLTLVSTNPNRMLDIYLMELEVSLLSWGQLGGYSFKVAGTKHVPPPPHVIIKRKNKNRVGVNISFGNDEVGKLIEHGSAVSFGLKVLARYKYYKPMVLAKWLIHLIEGGQRESVEGFCYPLRFGGGKGDQPTPCRPPTLDEQERIIHSCSTL